MLDKITLLASVAVMAVVSSNAHAQRGSDGHLNILYWQAASTVNPYLSGGTKDIEAASLVIEPLAHYDESGNMVPVLVEEIPTVENGGVADDLRSITWNLTPGITWSDGTPLTAHDVVFTGEYCLDEAAGCNSTSYFTGRDQDRGARRSHREDPFRCREAVPLRAIRRLDFSDYPEGPVPGLHGRQGPGVYRAELRPHRHRPLQGRGVPRQRRHHVLGERELPRTGQARVRDRHLQGGRGRGVRRACGARDR